MSLFSPAVHYPTPEEILDHEITFKQATVDCVREWKAHHFSGWKELDPSAKTDCLSRLATDLTRSYGLDIAVENGDAYYFDPNRSAITVDNRHPSIISTLHEVAHAIYGKSELQACRWSVWLFKKVFPNAYAELTFLPGSHLLVRKPTTCSPIPSSPAPVTSSSKIPVQDASASN